MHMGRHYRRRADGAGAGTASLSGAVPAEERGEPVGAGKRYRTDEQAICAANGLEQETPLPSGLLLIPRVR